MDNGVLAHVPRERRRVARALCPSPPAFPWLALVGPNLWVATIANVSRIGIAFTFSHIYPAGFQTTIELLNLTTRIWQEKRLRVVHCTPRGVYTWMLGASFIEPFSADEVKGLLP